MMQERWEEYPVALEAFLANFPLLFGYWKKLALFYVEQRGDWRRAREVRSAPPGAPFLHLLGNGSRKGAAASLFDCLRGSGSPVSLSDGREGGSDG